MINNLVILTPEDSDKTPTKTLDKNCKTISSYPKGMKDFYFDQIEYTDFHKALKKVFNLKNSFIVLGKLTELGEFYLESQTSGLRRKKGEKATIADKESTEMVLDLDDHFLEGFDPLDPSESIEYFLQESGINCDVTWQITSSQQLITKEDQTPLARIRLYFSTHKRFSLQHRKAWSQKVVQSDGSVYTCSQPIYTAPPNVVGKDPIKNRFGFIKGTRRSFILPFMEKAEVAKHSSFSRCSEFDFETSDLPDEVKDGTVYRRYFMPLAFHYANKNLSENDILALIAYKSLAIKNREFNEQNVKEYIRDAVIQIDREKSETKAKTNFKKEEKENVEVPVFPKNIEKCMPPVVQKLWKEFKKLPADLNETLLFPTFIAVHGFILRGKFVNSLGRIPNTLSLSLAQSGVGKDINSIDCINLIHELTAGNRDSGKAIMTIFSGMLDSPDDITGGTSLLQSFEGQDLFWIHTEATNVFRMLKSSDSNSHVKSLSDKLVSIYDGKRIGATSKAGKKISGIQKPNGQVIWFAQQDTIRECMNQSLIDSGFFGRMNLYMIPEADMKNDVIDYFPKNTSRNVKYEKEVLNFYGSNVWNDINATRNMQEFVDIKVACKKNLEIVLNEIKDREKGEGYEVKRPILKRMGQSMEAIHVIFTSMTKMWNMFTDDPDNDYEEYFDPEKLMPLVEYLNATKMYAVDNLIVKKADPVFEFVLEEINKIVTGKKKIQGNTQNKILADFGMVSKSLIKTNLVRSRTLKAQLESLSNDKDLSNKISSTIFNMTRDGDLVQKEINGGLYIGIRRND